MKKNRLTFPSLCTGLLLVALTAHGAGVPNLDVTISDAAGRLTYRGKTDANGVFTTGQVAPGNYVVQFQAKNVAANRDDYAIFAAAGSQRIVADAVSGKKFSDGGVAVRLKATRGTPIIGQVALGGVNALGTKIVHGVRYVLRPPETGDLGPRWVEEGTRSARNIARVHLDDPAMIKATPLGVAK